MAKIVGGEAWFNVPEAEILPRAMDDIDYDDDLTLGFSACVIPCFRGERQVPGHLDDALVFPKNG